MVLQFFTCSVHQKLLGNAFLKRCSCLSSSCAYFVIQWLNSFFQVGNDQRLPSHDGTGKRSSPLLLGFDPIDIGSVIFGTVDVIAFMVVPFLNRGRPKKVSSYTTYSSFVKRACYTSGNLK